jgi:hypothetical protein
MIFISYSHADLKFVEHLEEVLEASEFDTWRDKREIRAGNSFPKEIQYAIRSCSAVLIILGKSYATSDWQEAELHEALNHGKTVIPVVLGDGLQPPTILAARHQIRSDSDGDALDAGEFVRIFREIREALGSVDEIESEFDGDSSDPIEPDGLDELEDCLEGTRWSWRNGDDPGVYWIEFLAGGKVRRSWRPELGRWRVLDENMVIFGPHLLFFDMRAKCFKGAIPRVEESNPIREGCLIG